MAHLVFPLGVRLSTWIVLLIFLALGLRDRRAWLAAAAWVGGFETAYQATNTFEGIARHGLHPGALWEPVVVFGTFGLGVLFVVGCALKGARPDLRFVLPIAVLWAVWVATGFHVNGHTMIHFDAGAEAINEAIKTLWAIAYIVPLIRSTTAPVQPRQYTAASTTASVR